MTKEIKLVNKIKRLLNKAKIPRFLHYFGPKKYRFYEHVLALILMRESKMGYRRVSRMLRILGHKTPTYSALAKMAKRVENSVWEKILDATNNQTLKIVAIDGSGMSRPLPSPYYYTRINKQYPVDIPLKLSLAVDTRTKKILSLRLRAKNAHDIRDAKYLIKRLPSKPKTLVADKGYDAEWLHKFCKELGIGVCIPIRAYGKSRHNNWSLRKTAKFNKNTYARRNMIESVFSSIKRKFGASMSSVLYHTRRSEIYCRAIAHNIISL